jgi:DNA-binding NarL/FixJ family response regulator
MGGERQSSLRVAVGHAGLDPADAALIASLLAADDRLELTGEDPAIVVMGLEPAAIRMAAEQADVLVACADADHRAASGALKAGACAVIALDGLERTLSPAVHAVAAGLVVSPGGQRHPARRQALSAREKQILGLVVMGLTNAEIGRRLFLAESTVKYHLLSVYDKLGVRTRRDAADLVLDPRSGLGPGVMSLSDSGPPRRRAGYSEPTVR